MDPEVLRLGVVDDQGRGAVLGVELVAFGEGEPEPVGAKEAEDDRLLLQVGAGRIAPTVAFAPLGSESELIAHLAMAQFGQGLGGRGRQSTDKEAAPVLALAFETLVQLLDAPAYRHRLEGDEVGPP